MTRTSPAIGGPPRSRRALALLGLALVFSLSFFTRHLVGMWLVADGRYTPLVYNPASIRIQPPARYSFQPEDVSWDETRGYARYAQEILRGEFLGATADSYNPYLSHGQMERQPLWYRDRLGSALMAVTALSLGGDVPNAFLLADFVLPLAVAIALFLLCREFAFPASISVLAVSLVLWFNWQDTVGLILFLAGGSQNSSIFMRTPYPQLSSVTFALVFIALMRFHRHPSLRSACVLALGCALNMYIYFFAWSFAITMVGSYALFSALGSFSKSARAWLQMDVRASSLVWVTIGGAALLGSPVWLPLVGDSQLFRDTFVRVFGQYTHAPDLRHTIPILALLAATLAVPSRVWPTRWVWVVFWTSSVVILNQQVLTGKVNQPGHYVLYIIAPFALLFLCDLALCVVRWIDTPNRRVHARLVVPAAVCVFCAGLTLNVYKLWRGAHEASNYNVIDTSLSGLIDFMKTPDVAGLGFLSNDDYLSTVLPAYVRQKPLRPWPGDPIAEAPITQLHAAAWSQFGDVIGAVATDRHPPATTLRIDPRKVLLILNRHKANYRALDPCEIAYANNDFLVVRPLPCSSRSRS